MAHPPAKNPSSAYFDGATYTEEQLEFIKACQRFREEHHYRNPTYQEILTIAHSLGYRRTEDTEPYLAIASNLDKSITSNLHGVASHGKHP